MFKISGLLSAALVLGPSLYSQTTAPAAVPRTPVQMPAQTLAAGDVQFNEKVDQNNDDMEALRRWIRDKRMVTVKEIGGDLSLSGEVRTEFQDTNETVNGVRQRGQGSVTEKPQYAWDVEVNVMIDYRTDRTWAAIKLEFDDDMGIRSGRLDKIRLEKAYLGGRLVPGDTFTMDGELGRRYLFNVFESKVEFGSLFDGVLFRLNKASPSIADFYFNTGALLVDDKTNHYAFVAEMGGLRIANTGLNMKYSIIDWYKPYANELNNQRFKFLVSQFLTYYQIYPEWLGKRLIKFYGAGLCNHLASGVVQTHGEMQRWAWYTGVSIGLVKKKNDWALDANYQWVQAQAVPEYDAAGIGLGNSSGLGFYTNNINGDPASGATTAQTAFGSTNYHGFEIEALYAITDNLTVLQNFKYSRSLDNSIGPPHRQLKQYELEFIYAF